MPNGLPVTARSMLNRGQKLDTESHDHYYDNYDGFWKTLQNHSQKSSEGFMPPDHPRG